MTSPAWPSSLESAGAGWRTRARFKALFLLWIADSIRKRYSMLPFFLIPPLCAMIALQTAAVPDLPKWVDWGGFAVLSVYMVYRYERIVRDVQANADQRQAELIAALKEVSQICGRLMDAITEMLDSRSCPFDGDDHPARRRPR